MDTLLSQSEPEETPDPVEIYRARYGVIINDMRAVFRRAGQFSGRTN